MTSTHLILNARIMFKTSQNLSMCVNLTFKNKWITILISISFLKISFCLIRSNGSSDHNFWRVQHWFINCRRIFAPRPLAVIRPSNGWQSDHFAPWWRHWTVRLVMGILLFRLRRKSDGVNRGRVRASKLKRFINPSNGRSVDGWRHIRFWRGWRCARNSRLCRRRRSRPIADRVAAAAFLD